MKRLVFLLAMVLLLLVGCITPDPGASPLALPASPDFLSDVPDPDVPTLPAFLEMLAGPTGWVIVGAVLSALLATWPWYNAQGPALKRGLILGLSAFFAVGARLLITYVPPSFWEGTAAYWYIVAGIIMQWIGSQGWFKMAVKPQREEEHEWRVLE